MDDCYEDKVRRLNAVMGDGLLVVMMLVRPWRTSATRPKVWGAGALAFCRGGIPAFGLRAACRGWAASRRPPPQAGKRAHAACPVCHPAQLTLPSSYHTTHPCSLSLAHTRRWTSTRTRSAPLARRPRRRATPPPPWAPGQASRTTRRAAAAGAVAGAGLCGRRALRACAGLCMDGEGLGGRILLHINVRFFALVSLPAG